MVLSQTMMTDKSVFAFVTLLSVFPCFSVICDFLHPCFDASPAENMVQHLPDPQNVFLHAYQCISPHKQMDILSEPTCSLNFLHYLTFSCFVLFFSSLVHVGECTSHCQQGSLLVHTSPYSTHFMSTEERSGSVVPGPLSY